LITTPPNKITPDKDLDLGHSEKEGGDAFSIELAGSQDSKLDMKELEDLD
jgi:hypothetical protein